MDETKIPGQNSVDENPTHSNNLNELTDEIDFSEIIGDRYQIVSILGHGGMGTVFKVEQIFLKQTFALKTLTGKNFTDVAIRRFQKEAQAAGKLTHPNLVRAVDFGVLKNGNPFYIMDLVEGDNLAEYTKKTGLLKLEEVFKIFIPICFALGYAHSEGIIHRDIKPGNIMLARTGNPTDPFVPKIVDFGIAKLTDADDGVSVNLTQTGEVFGTPLYMSPEQCYGKQLDSRSDIYSLGCVLYEALTGAPPFTGETALSLMLKHQSEEPASLKEASLGKVFPEKLEKIVIRTLAKDPNKRYQRLEDLAADLANLQLDNNITLQSAPQSTLEEVTRKIETKGGLKSKSSKVLALGLSILFFSIGYGIRASMEKPINPVAVELTDEEAEKRYNNLLKLGNMRYLIENHARKTKTYEFQQQFSFCKIKFVKGGKLRERRAFGKIEMPGNSPVWFYIPQSILLAYPYILRGFRANDLHSLTLGSAVDMTWMTENSEGIYDVALAYASRITGLQEVIAFSTTTTDVGIRCIEDLPNLKILNIADTQVTADALNRVKNFDKLEFLGADRVTGAKKLFERLSKSKTINSLSLSKLDLTNADLQKLKTARNLKHLTIIDNEKLTDGALVGFENLMEINFAGTRISPKCIPTLMTMKNLEKISVDEKYWALCDAELLEKLKKGKITVHGMSKGKNKEDFVFTNWGR